MRRNFALSKELPKPEPPGEYSNLYKDASRYRCLRKYINRMIYDTSNEEIHTGEKYAIFTRVSLAKYNSGDLPFYSKSFDLELDKFMEKAVKLGVEIQ